MFFVKSLLHTKTATDIAKTKINNTMECMGNEHTKGILYKFDWPKGQTQNKAKLKITIYNYKYIMKIRNTLEFTEIILFLRDNKI